MITGNREVFVLNIRSLGFNADNQFPPLSIQLGLALGRSVVDNVFHPWILNG